MEKKYVRFANIAFIVTCGAIILFLLKAPEETTAKLPKDDNHIRFFSIKSKKAAEKFCIDCHSPDKVMPLPKNHPPKYRCLFCHKRDM